jgi:hypothetical protein
MDTALLTAQRLFPLEKVDVAARYNLPREVRYCAWCVISTCGSSRTMKAESTMYS